MSDEKKKFQIVNADDNHKTDFLKPVTAIHVYSSLSFNQKKALNIILFNAVPYAKKDVETFHVPIGDIKKGVGYESRNYQFFKDTLKELVNIKIEWNLLGDGDPNSEDSVERGGIFVAISELDFDRGMVAISMPPSMRKLLSTPGAYSRVNLQLMKQFTDGYAYDLYENVARFRKVKTTGFLPVDIVRKMMGISPDKSSYSEFKVFKARRLLPAIDHINEKSDIEITKIELKKSGRQIVAIKFDMIEKPNPSFQKTVDQSRVEILARLLALGISDRIAYRYIDEHEIEYLSGNLDVVEERIKTAPPGREIKNYAMYFKKAISEDWRPIKPAIDAHRETELKADQEAKQKDAEAARAAEEERQRQIQDKRREAKRDFDELPEKEQADIEGHFLAYLGRVGNKIVLDACRNHGVGSKLVVSTFSAWLAGEFENK